MALLRVVNESAESGKSSGSLNKSCRNRLRRAAHMRARGRIRALRRTPYHGRAVLFVKESVGGASARRGRSDAFTARVGVFVYRVLQSIYIPHEAVNAAETGVADSLHTVGGKPHYLSAAVRDKLKVAAVNSHQLFFKSRTVAETGIVIKEAVLGGNEANIIESQIAAKRLGGAKKLTHAAAERKSG